MQNSSPPSPDLLTLLRAAGLPNGLEARQADEWAARRLQVDERTVRRWRLSGQVPHRTVLALRGLAGRTLATPDADLTDHME